MHSSRAIAVLLKRFHGSQFRLCRHTSTTCTFSEQRLSFPILECLVTTQWHHSSTIKKSLCEYFQGDKFIGLSERGPKCHPTRSPRRDLPS
jgi:hypothetical protein